MELSTQVLAGLEVVGNEATLSSESFNKVLGLSLSTALDPGNRENDKNHPEVGDGSMSSKEACYALTTLLLELARLDADTTTISALLEEIKIDQERAKTITKAFFDNKAELRAALERLSSTSVPHLVDSQWRLDYYMKNNHSEKVNRAEYLIELDTQISGQEGSSVQFACTQEQLQDLVSNLKDATKSLERFAQQN